MRIELQIPDELWDKMKKYKNVDWEKMLIKAIDGFISDFTILDKLKDFWGTKRTNPESNQKQ